MRVKGKKPSRNSFRIIGTFGLIFAGVLGGILFSSQGYYGHISEWVKKAPKKEILPKITKPPEVINIRISQEKLQDIKVLGEKALKKGLMRPEHATYFDAKIEYKDKFLPIKMRLKGDWVDHLNSDKWSYRIKIKDGNTLLGMRNFSLQHPKTRAYLEEWFGHQLLKKEGVISLRYHFVKVFINGTYKGIYALEEHFDKRLIEYNQRREGPIIKFSEDLLWDKRAAKLGDSRSFVNSYEEAHVTGFELSKTYEDATQIALYEKAVVLLSSFKHGKLPAEQVFDIDLMAKYWAIIDITEGSHGAIWHNLRFYYNPITSRLEPIAYDMSYTGPVPEINGKILLNIEEPFNTQILSNKSFVEAYLLNLHRVGRLQYFNKQWFALHEDYENELAILSKEYQGVQLDKKKYLYRIQVIQHALGTNDGLQTGIVKNQEGKWQLQFSNLRLVPLELISLQNKGGKIIEFPKGEEKIIIQPVNMMKGIWSFETTDWPSIEPLESKNGWSVNYKIVGLPNFFQTKVEPAPLDPVADLNLDILRRKENTNDFPFVLKDDQFQTCFIEEGNFIIDKDLICPRGYSVTIAAGTNLVLKNKANLIIRGSLIINGSADNPVEIESMGGQGIIVQQKNKESRLKNVIFKGLRNPKKQGWEIPGGLTFHEGVVTIITATFIKNHSEDALNLVRCKFTLGDLHFQDIYSDAIDGDFTNGLIKDCSFKSIGNDAIDVSGSRVVIQNCKISNASDKGISAGENSYMEISSTFIDSTSIGIAAKDLSHIICTSSILTNVEVGYTAFQKKSEFGPAKIELIKCNLPKIDRPFLIEKGSRFTHNEKEISPNADTVKLMMYGNQFGKKSK